MGNKIPKVHRGVSAYFCHNFYEAQMLNMAVANGKSIVQKVTCGILITPDTATYMAESGTLDGFGDAHYHEPTIVEEMPQKIIKTLTV